MPAPLRDVRVVLPAVNLPGPLAAARLAVFAAGGCTTAANSSQISDATALLIAGRGFAALHGLRAPALLNWRMLTDLPCELERSPSRYGLQVICGTASAAVIERQ